MTNAVYIRVFFFGTDEIGSSEATRIRSRIMKIKKAPVAQAFLSASKRVDQLIECTLPRGFPYFHITM